MMETPITFLGCEFDNRIYLKRDDLFPFSFGGNKARIAQRYFDVIDVGDYDCVVTYGGPNSNLCRAVAAMAAQRNMKCVTVMHGDGNPDSFNLDLVCLSGAEPLFCPVSQVGNTIDDLLERLRLQGYKPYFIPGGGLGVIGSRAYISCFDEIQCFENRSGVHFDYLFLPSGTGTTQSGLVCGKLLHESDCEIIGLSIARTAQQGRAIILKNVRDFFAAEQLSFPDDAIERAVVFEDAYRCGGYAMGDYSGFIESVWRKYAVPLDHIYTGKAYAGMGAYLNERRISGKTVLFLHTGALPLFFDDIMRYSR